MPQTIIIGAGVIGCSLALELARRGEQPLVLDKHGAAGHGSTSASCGIVRCFYSTLTMAAMARSGRGIWETWRDYLRAPEDEDLARFEQPGMLFIPAAIDDGIRAIMGHMQAVGVEAELLSGAEVAARFPFFDTASQAPVRQPNDPDFFEPTGRTIAGAVFEHGAGYVVSPMLAAQNLRDAGEREGAQFQLGQGVVRVERSEEAPRFTLIMEDGGSLTCDVLVNVAGPHSSVVNTMVGAQLPIETRALRREVHAVDNPCHTSDGGPGVPVVGDLDGGLYFRPEAGGNQLITGSLDPACDTLEWVDPDGWNDGVTTDAHQRQVMRMMKRFPDVRFEKPSGVAGLYDVTPIDWNPVLDRTDTAGYYVAIGTSGSSFKTAPVIGSVMAQLIQTCEGGHDHDARPLQVKLPGTGFEIDLGFFSRHRGAHTSTGTVIG
ncbi:MAG: sarcosine oxidase subunit beta [Chlamydiales bacterium]